MDELSGQEKTFRQYLMENNREAAVRLLVKLIVKKAAEKEFGQAEFLREKLFEVDSMALNEIIKTGEIIEKEKRNAIDQKHLATWSDFYENLTTEETIGLFYSLNMAKYPANHMVYRQGEMGSRLYFIDEGRLKMFYRQPDRSILLKILKPGDIFGEDTFFFLDGLYTTSVITDSQVKLYELLKGDLLVLNKKFPGLESKLNDYHSSKESVAELLAAKKLERRIDKRFNLPGKVLVQILKPKDKPASKPFRGELLDISASGLAFIMKMTQRGTGELLGQKLNMKITFDELSSEQEIKCIGSVVALNTEPFHEYVVHVNFNENLNPSFMKDLEELMNLKAVPNRI